MDVELHGCEPAHRACMSAIRDTNYYDLALINPKAAHAQHGLARLCH